MGRNIIFLLFCSGIFGPPENQHMDFDNPSDVALHDLYVAYLWHIPGFKGVHTIVYTYSMMLCHRLDSTYSYQYHYAQLR